MARKATKEEQEVIDQCNDKLKSMGLSITELKEDKGGGAVIPTKGF